MNNDQLQTLLNDPMILGGIAAAAVLLLLLFVVMKRRRRTADVRQLKKVVKELSNRMMAHAVLPDGMGDEVVVDYLVHTDRAMLVLNVQNYPGNLFGGEKIDFWTQVVKNGSHKFANPLPYLQSCEIAVKQLAPGIPVISRVVFTEAGEFPKGIPAGVAMVSQLIEDIKKAESGLAPIEQPGIDAAWEKLRAALQEKNQQKLHLSKKDAAL